jgi:hypothetical protein
MSDQRYLWVVEVEFEGGWAPTPEVELFRSEAREQLKLCREFDSGRRYRLAKYEAVKEGR